MAATCTDGNIHVLKVSVFEGVAVICACCTASTVGECNTLSIVCTQVGNLNWV